ncbi:MAG: type II toxin-antitoxin system VapC family toxin [Gemmataceae bacterium]
MTFLDTDTVTLLSYDHPRVTARVGGEQPDQIAVPSGARAEALAGRLDALRKAATGADAVAMQARLDALERLLSRFRIVSFDDAATGIFDRLRADRRAKKVGRADLLIASIALAHKATLVTRNLKDFRLVPGLAVENWAD